MKIFSFKKYFNKFECDNCSFQSVKRKLKYMAKKGKQIIKIYEMNENFNNITGFGNFRNELLEEDSGEGEIIEHQVFVKDNKVYVSCLFELS